MTVLLTSLFTLYVEYVAYRHIIPPGFSFAYPKIFPELDREKNKKKCTQCHSESDRNLFWLLK